MFDTFGEFGSAEEINAAAEGLANKGDEEGLKLLAKENGIPEEAATLYYQGETCALVDIREAAVGKIEIEKEELAIEGIMADWIQFIETECMESEKMAKAVRSEKRSLRGCMAHLLLESLLRQKQVDQPILDIVEKEIKLRGIDLKKQIGIQPGWLKYTKIGFPGAGKAKKLIREYYLGIGGVNG